MNKESTEIISDRSAQKPSFQGQVLRRVYRVWLVRKFIPILVLEITALSIVIYQIARAVFVERFMQNAMRVFFAEPEGIGKFFVRAFLETEWITKVLSILLAVMIALVIRHITQGMLRLLLVRKNYFASVRRVPDSKSV